MENEHLKCECGKDKFNLSERDGCHILTCRQCGQEMSGCMIKCEPCGRLLWLPEKKIDDIEKLQLGCKVCRNGFTIAKDLVTVEKMKYSPIINHVAMHY
jgi:hypothetical protein